MWCFIWFLGVFAAAAAFQLTSFSSLGKWDLICSQFDLSEAIRCLRSKQIIFFHQKTNVPKIIIVFDQKRKFSVGFAISSVFFLVALAGDFSLPAQPVHITSDGFFRRKPSNKGRNLQIDHKSSYGQTFDSKRNDDDTHVFHMLMLSPACVKSVRFQKNEEGEGEKTRKSRKNNNNCWNMCKSIVISYFWGRSIHSTAETKQIGLFFSSMILFGLLVFSVSFLSFVIVFAFFLCVTIHFVPIFFHLLRFIFFISFLLIKSVMLHFVAEQWKFCCIPKFIVQRIKKEMLTISMTKVPRMGNKGCASEWENSCSGEKRNDEILKLM